MKPKSSLLIALVILALLTGALPALANSTAAAPQLPWDFDVVMDDADVSRISVGIDAYTKAPMVAYYDWVEDLLMDAVYRGPGYPGNCGTGNTWYCWSVGVGYSAGEHNDVAYFYNPYANYRRTGFFLYDQAQNSLEYVERYGSDQGVGQTQTRILDLDLFCLEQDCAVTSAVSLVYDDYGHAHAVAVIDTAMMDHLLYFHQLGGPGGNCDLYGGSDYWEFQSVIMEPNAAIDPSLTILPPESPRIAYYRPADSSLRYAYPNSSNPNCGSANDWRCIEIDDTGSTGNYPSIAYGDALHIAFFNAQTGYIWLAKYVSSGGNCGYDWNGITFVYRWQCDAIDNVDTLPVKHGISLVMDGSEPVIAYMDANDGDQTELKLAQRVQRAGLTHGNCGPGDIFQTWDCRTLDQGPYGLGAEVDMYISSSGGLFIGYLEDNYDAHQSHVLAARQYYQVRLPLIRK
jgi:hypothetical protein